MSVNDQRENARVDNPELVHAMKSQAIVYHATLFLWHHSTGAACMPDRNRGIGNESIRETSLSTIDARHENLVNLLFDILVALNLHSGGNLAVVVANDNIIECSRCKQLPQSVKRTQCDRSIIR